MTEEKQYIITESSHDDIQCVAKSLRVLGLPQKAEILEKIFDNSRPYSSASDAKVLEDLEKENSARIDELKSWIKIYQDEKQKCNALAVLGERQYLAVKYAKLRQGKQPGGNL